MIFQCSQQHRLLIETQLPNFIQEDKAVIRFSEQTLSI